MFDDKKEIEPYMEEEKGPTFEFCKEMATKYNSYVAAGYPRVHSMSLSLSFLIFHLYFFFIMNERKLMFI